MRASTTDENRGTVLVGPAGQWDFGFTVTAGKPARVWVPDGTRAIAVFDGQQPRASAREIPLGNADTIAID
ncbi:MAG TPA: hypothetical protein VF384_15860 [Planctomycetota bacterium]